MNIRCHMGIPFFPVSVINPTKNDISECKFLVAQAMCSKDGPWKGIPYSEKKQWFWKKTDVSLVSTARNPIYKLFRVIWSLYLTTQQAVGILLPARAGNKKDIFQLYHAWSI